MLRSRAELQLTSDYTKTLDGDDFVLADDTCIFHALFYALIINILKQLIWWEVDYMGVDFMGSWYNGSWSRENWSHGSWSRGRIPTWGIGRRVSHSLLNCFSSYMLCSTYTWGRGGWSPCLCPPLTPLYWANNRSSATKTSCDGVCYTFWTQIKHLCSCQVSFSFKKLEKYVHIGPHECIQ